MKKIAITSLMIILTLSLLTSCGKKNKTQPNNNQNSQEIKKSNDSIQTIQIIGNLKFEIKGLKHEDGVIKLEYLIINESNEKVNIPKYEMTVTDGKKILYKLTMTHKDNVLEPNDSKLIKKEIKKDLTSATSITFELIKDEKIDSD